jgi:hypothetical protein
LAPATAGVVPTEESHLESKFIDDLDSFEPSKKSEEILHAETLRQLNNFVELRRTRLANVTTGIPAVFWWVVAIVAVITVVLLATLGMGIHVHFFLGAVVSLFLGLVIFLIAAMDHPFRGEVSVGPDAYEAIYDSLMKPTDVVSKSMAGLIATAQRLGFDVVDEVVKENGGTATLFVEAGDEYVRVATNVKKDDGSRAIGTTLDPSGPAIEKIKKGEASPATNRSGTPPITSSASTMSAMR